MEMIQLIISNFLQAHYNHSVMQSKSFPWPHLILRNSLGAVAPWLSGTRWFTLRFLLFPVPSLS